MNVTLTPELEKIVEKKIKTGRFNSVGEVVREGLYLLDLEDDFQEMKRERLREELLKAKQQFENGQFITVNSAEQMKAYLEDIKQRGRKRLAKENGE